MKISLLYFFIFLFQTSLWSINEPKGVPAYYDGNHFYECHPGDVLSTIKTIENKSVYFKPGHITCYGHALLDGVIPLYSILKQYNLLDKPINLIIDEDANTVSNGTFKNILQLICDIFDVKTVININEQKQSPIFFRNLIAPEYVPRLGSQHKTLAFYHAFPESFKYIYALKELGMRDNIVFQDRDISDNIVKEFVSFITKKYQIDLPLIKNRILLVLRPSSRCIINFNELATALMQKGYDVAIVDFEHLSIEQQIIETIQSEYFIGTYGSHLVNAIFLNSNANVMILWHKYAKYFWSRRYCVINSAFLSTGVKLIEYDKPDYDPRDVYGFGIAVPDYFYRSNNMNILRPEKINMADIIKYPLPAMYEITNVNLYIDPQMVLKLIKDAN